MRALLDTHVFLWWILDQPRLSPRARDLICDGTSELFFSAASGWEIAIKAQLGKIKLPDDPLKFTLGQLEINAFTELPVRLAHALQVATLPALHRDPFDRLLVAQSQVEHLPLVSADPLVARYDVQVIW
jgi:PIN domain nuclease of toxin-antitoxin system